MLISLSRRKRHKKVKSPDAQNRSIFLKALFGQISGDSGNSLMRKFTSGDYKGFGEAWKKVSNKVLEQSIEKAKELGKYEEKDKADEDSNQSK